jgi:dinuclear metal center YbgI/SA1388 family protein
LQVEGKAEVQRIVSGVTASQALLDAAVEAQADLVLVHHGFFWKGESPCITGTRHRRIATLINNGISLLGYHLPLDAHPELGNNAQLGLRLGITVQGTFGAGRGPDLGVWGQLDRPYSSAELAAHIGTVLDRSPLHLPGGPKEICRVGWCTGAAQSYIEAAADQGLDAFISGEVSEQTVHSARERGLHYFAAGHHATERDGARALGQHLAEKFALEHQFIDIPNPV